MTNDEYEIDLGQCILKYKITKNNIKIYDSYKIKNKYLMEYVLYEIARNDKYRDTRDRYIGDYIREWRAHNILFKLPFKYIKEHCKDCDLTNNDSKFNLLIYAILGRI